MTDPDDVAPMPDWPAPHPSYRAALEAPDWERIGPVPVRDHDGLDGDFIRSKDQAKITIQIREVRKGIMPDLLATLLETTLETTRKVSRNDRARFHRCSHPRWDQPGLPDRMGDPERGRSHPRPSPSL